MTYPCPRCNRDDWDPICAGDDRCQRTDKPAAPAADQPADHVAGASKMVAQPAAQAVAQPHGPWSEADAVALAHRAGFAGTCWTMGPEELVHMLNLAPVAQPLTDDQLDALRRADSGQLNYVTLREFRVIARAVERAMASAPNAGIQARP